ncbi:unnamed protein product [Cutaneotrichosporon oleaginosum]
MADGGTAVQTLMKIRHHSTSTDLHSIRRTLPTTTANSSSTMTRPHLASLPRLRALRSLPLPLHLSTPTRPLRTPPLARSLSSASRATPTRLLIPGTLRARRRLLAVLALLPLFYFLRPASPLNPQVYSEHPVASVTPVGPAHVELVVRVPESERAQFGADAVVFSPYGVPPRPHAAPYVHTEGAAPPGTVVVQHVMVKNPDLMIERAYTPVNDVGADGEMRLVVKRVRGGEVGSAFPAGRGQRRPPRTGHDLCHRAARLRPHRYAVAPFLQLLAKDVPGTTRYTLLHQTPYGGREDWSAKYIAPMAAKWGDALDVRRIQPGVVRKEDVAAALEGAQRPLVLTHASALRHTRSHTAPGPARGLVARDGSSSRPGVEARVEMDMVDSVSRLLRYTTRFAELREGLPSQSATLSIASPAMRRRRASGNPYIQLFTPLRCQAAA